MNLVAKKNGHRTMFYEGDQHVATIIKQGKEHFQWVIPSGGGYAGSYDDAYAAILEELER